MNFKKKIKNKKTNDDITKMDHGIKKKEKGKKNCKLKLSPSEA